MSEIFITVCDGNLIKVLSLVTNMVSAATELLLWIEWLHGILETKYQMIQLEQAQSWCLKVIQMRFK